ncbi:MAG: TM0106 family RecB-like putative nuclease [Mycobacteriales bacterium]|nr:TM0106 family RecB-like putative nuclease [Mycobacteriales bacterium]
MTDRIITPSKITAWLDCAHYLAMKHQVEDGLRERPHGGMGAFARLLADKGLQHERDCLDKLRLDKVVHEVPERLRGESFAAWTERIGDPLALDVDVLYQVPLLHDGIRGIADFLVRVVGLDGSTTWEPVDAKLARKEAKPGHVLQLCFYADAIEARTGRRPEQMHLWLGSGDYESLDLADFAPYWRRLRGQLRALVDAPQSDAVTRPEPCDHCAFCEFADVCDAQWRDEDALLYVAGLRAADRQVLEAGGVATLTALADRVDPVVDLSEERLARVRTQADLQRAARDGDGAAPPYVLIPAGEDAVWGRGLEQLPEPDDGDVFLDFEGHPFWTAKQGLFFLLGLIELDATGSWVYRCWWAHSPEAEAQAAGLLIDYLAERRHQHPGMHVYHYNHTERSSLERLATDYGVGEVVLEQLVTTGAFVDLLLVARNALQVGTESYGLKALETLTDYERGHDIDQGAGAVVEYENWMKDGDAAALSRIASYNEDDVRATRALRDWLVGVRAEGLAWRHAVLDPDDELPELDEQVAALHAFGPETPEHLLGDVLGYWRREWKAHLAPLLARCGASTTDLFEDPEALAGLHSGVVVERLGARGQAVTPVLRCALPPQSVDGIEVGDAVLFPTPEGPVGYSSVVRLDPESGEADLMWSATCADLGWQPSAVVLNDWVSPKPKPAALSELAASVLAGSTSGPEFALLRRDLPRFVAGRGPVGGVFGDDVHEMTAWVAHLDSSYVAIQGPPGTGKTYRGAHLVRTLVAAGKRVGITGPSHSAINNLLEAVLDLYDENGDLEGLSWIKRGGAGVRGVPTAANPKAGAKSSYAVVAGTPWHFAGADMAAAPVDVLLVDEAGQVGLADALAACRSARNVILLGDPQQLPQVSLASHPGGGGLSVLEHVLGGERTVSADRGVFITETRRMHPDVCGFISDEIYDGRLSSHESCAGQTTVFGTGLRWLRATHTGRVTESEEEAELVVAEIGRLLGTPWTDQHGVVRPLGAGDVLVVAPYNDQVNLLRSRLAADPAMAEVAVGTVDKFQGRQAAVVLFSMTTSTAADMHRSADFLFSRNRFNVAVSRARCLAYLVCTEELLNSRGRDLEEMRLISTLCAFAERAT